MPQMSPMNWFFLFLLTYLLFYMSISKMFFFSKIIIFSKKQYFNLNNFLLKI